MVLADWDGLWSMLTSSPSGVCQPYRVSSGRMPDVKREVSLPRKGQGGRGGALTDEPLRMKRGPDRTVEQLMRLCRRRTGRS